MNTQDIRKIAQARTELNQRIKEMLVNELSLPIEPRQIDSDQPLFGRGLELDSLDTLEVVSAIEETFAVYLTDDDQHVFGSVNKLADEIEARS
ncbi:acyl carrier protein [Actinomyces gerencseriae]|jgi:putative acyl carrier protein|uniref:acyl carrier protein n=1 Tax=Actinomyces gerencseriae TaxID=52769 RepID=UPI0023F4C9E4|nr:phosphopantetheine-binding protein [Actinomyces gerencseriae]